VEWLLGRGADPTMVDEVTRATPLHIADRRGLDHTSHVLLSNGADPNAVDKFGVTPLHVAAAFDASPELWVILLQHGADSSLVDAESHAPLDLVADQKERKNLQTIVSSFQKPKARPSGQWR
jgi:ankyrin repeat protein